jgi:integrase
MGTVMARTINRLSARAVSTTDKPGMLADGGGLYLQITASGAKTWIYRFTMFGKKRDMGLGSLNTISLSAAREVSAECRVFVRDGIDPIARRKALRLADMASSTKALTFSQCAEAYIEAHKAGWKNAKHGDQWRNTLKQYAYPELGNLAVSAIDTGLVLKVLEPIWETKTETASRLRGRIESVLDWATVRNHRQGENPARWRGHLALTLPKPSMVQKVSHHNALSYEAVGVFIAALRERTEISARALEFIVLTATRTGEVIGADWSEVDLANGIWNIPAHRMKAEVEHRVPLSSRASAILKGLPRIEGNKYIFPGLKPKRPLSNMACLNLLKRMDHADITVHGFRSTFRDWAAEQTAFPREVAERALAHTIKDKAEAAYQRRDLFDKRQKLMDAWADYCTIDTSEHDKVTPIRKKAK